MSSSPLSIKFIPVVACYDSRMIATFCNVGFDDLDAVVVCREFGRERNIEECE